MQIVSTGDNYLHENVKSCFLGKIKQKYFSMSSVENFTQSGKR